MFSFVNIQHFHFEAKIQRTGCGLLYLLGSYICYLIGYFHFLLQAQSDKIKLQLRVEELQHKYEPKGM